MRTYAGLVVLAVWAFTTLWPAAAQTPAGEPFVLNTTSAGQKNGSRVATGADGRFVAVWRSEDQDGDGWGIVARWFDSAGGPLSGEVQVNVVTAGSQVSPRVVATGPSDFTVAWGSPGGGVVARRFDGVGNPLTGELPISATASIWDAAIAANANGRVLASWLRPEGDDRIVEARRFGADGLPIEDEFVVATATYQNFVDGTGVELRDDESFLVAWSDGREVSARLYDSQGDPTSAAFQVSQLNYPYSFFSTPPGIASEDSGRYRLVWINDVNLEEVDFMTRTVTPAGALGELTALNTPAAWTCGFSMTGNGEFVVGYQPYDPPDLRGRRFDDSAGPISSFVIQGEPSSYRGCGGIAHQGDDSREFVVVWSESAAGGSAADIWGRLFSPRIFADGFESGDTSGWSTTVP